MGVLITFLLPQHGEMCGNIVYYNEPTNFKIKLMIKHILILGIIIIMSAGAVLGDIQQGVELFNKKDYVAAESFFNEYLQKHPKHAGANYYMGRIKFINQKFNEAKDHFEMAIQSDTGNYRYYYWRGRTHLSLLMASNLIMKGVYAGKTLSDFKTAVDLNPDDLESRLYLAEYYGQAPGIAGGSTSKAISHYRVAISKHPGVEYLYTGIGNQYRAIENYDSAMYYYQMAIDSDEESATAHFEYGKTSVISGKELNSAENLLLKALSLGLTVSNQSEAYYYLGKLNEKMNQIERAKKNYQKSIQLNEENDEARKALRKLN